MTTEGDEWTWKKRKKYPPSPPLLRMEGEGVLGESYYVPVQ